MGRITVNGTIAQFSAKISVPVALREVKGSRAKEGRPHQPSLDNIWGQINKQSICDRETYVTAEKVRNAFIGFGQNYKSLMVCTRLRETENKQIG